MCFIKLVKRFCRINNYTQPFPGLLLLLPEGLRNKKVNYTMEGATLVGGASRERHRKSTMFV